MDAPILYHIRRPLRRSRSTNFYRDRSDRGQGTFCGAPETQYDVTHRDRVEENCERFTLCPQCQSLKEAI